ncbi:MAG: ABC transporter ATP-binding protein [Parachlamydiaceae bacterium]|nr:ABC transporter ATP-binding protein [Parachlamydiaceae bacterium]
MENVIKIDRLCKTFRLQKSASGMGNALKGLFFPEYIEINAIRDLSLSVNKGERIAFIGPNGAGKSTAIKMLTGILYPTSGSIEVLGMIPWQERHALGYKIGTVFGQRSQLWYHLPPADTFDLLSKIYEIDKSTYKACLQKLIDLFEIGDLMQKPVRQLSLGQRMRCEIVASLLHNPQILFLDEPTIGLDINAKLNIRSLLNTLSKEHGITLFLTSHDTADIEQVCDRVIVIDKGCIVMDKPLRELKKSYMRKKIVTIITDEETLQMPVQIPGLKILENTHHHFKCEIDLETASIKTIIEEALSKSTIKDMTIEDPSMEEIIRLVYQSVASNSNEKL